MEITWGAFQEKKKASVRIMVLKTGSDQLVGPFQSPMSDISCLVQSPTNDISGPALHIEPFSKWIGHKLPEAIIGLVNKTNQAVLNESLPLIL